MEKITGSNIEPNQFEIQNNPEEDLGEPKFLPVKPIVIATVLLIIVGTVMVVYATKVQTEPIGTIRDVYESTQSTQTTQSTNSVK